MPKGPSISGQGLSWAGVFGAGLAILSLIAIGAAFLSDGESPKGVVFTLLALLFIPALAVSIADTPKRTVILRLSTGLALVIALLGGIVDLGIPIVMAPPTLVLAQAAGLVFAGRR